MFIVHNNCFHSGELINTYFILIILISSSPPYLVLPIVYILFPSPQHQFSHFLSSLFFLPFKLYLQLLVYYNPCNIYFSVFDLFYLAFWTQGASFFLQINQMHSSLWFTSILLCIHSSFSFSIHELMDMTASEI